MREIKFRVWDKVSDKMLQLSTETEENLLVLFENAVDLMGMGFYHYPNTEWMQSTGLKDKDGKEIYEGDIVRYLDGIETSSESGFDCREFMNTGVINFDTECGMYDVTNKNGVDRETLFEDEGEFEIIGNIYENPELLEVAK